MRFTLLATLAISASLLSACANRTDDRRVGTGATDRDTGVTATGSGTMNNPGGTAVAPVDRTNTANSNTATTTGQTPGLSTEPSTVPAGTIASRPERSQITPRATTTPSPTRSESDPNIIGGIDTTTRGSSPAGTGAPASSASAAGSASSELSTPTPPTPPTTTPSATTSPSGTATPNGGTTGTGTGTANPSNAAGTGTGPTTP
ncbi:MAG TPA: hypothetical protein VMB21_01465 [Candidatus Limnocylindria bacterium]|nr:hypothetical protein [Candidatus Limnocylindria bacterium]